MKDLLQIIQLFVQLGTLAAMLYAFSRFLSKPHDTLEQRVTTMEVEIKDIKQSLLQGNDKFREQDKSNEVIIRSLIALINWEIQYCLLEDKPMSKDLEKAKDDLNDYLAMR